MSCSSTTALVWGSAGPIDLVLYFEPEPGDPTDSGFSLLRVDAPRPRPAADTPWEAVCLDCVLGEWSGIGRGLDLAREHGAAELAGGEWRAEP